HHLHPADPHLYDLVVNTGVLDLESIVDLILLALQRKAARLSTSPGELGQRVLQRQESIYGYRILGERDE
ncbi:MAG: hypothetical protein ACJ788_10405, partial [Ktedonobacteraceae bacterium]